MSDKSTETRYDFHVIERKWRERWEEQEVFRTEENSDKPKFYGLVFFPYPSGAGISVGHCRNYIPVDVACRHKAMQGYNVLQPMGWDAFGQPAENEAIKKGRNPREMVPEYAANYKRQLQLAGISYDWSREIDSSRPDYYRWTQWFFLLLHRRALAYRADTPINWCPSCKTGLANEEVVNGRCWRCGSLVGKRPMPQWYFRITSYADRLISGLDTIEWPDGIKTMQREWIGRKKGAEVDFAIEGRSDLPYLRVFTTRPDTLWGATFMAIAPEHPLVADITTDTHRAEVEEYVERAQRISEIDRLSVDRTKTGVFTGTNAVNPVNGEAIPIYVADYVLMGYGTGAIMAVPAHDQRDFEFAKKYDIPIVLVYRTTEDRTAESMTEALPSGGAMENFTPSPNARVGADFPFAGLPNNDETVGKVIRWLEEKGVGEGVVNYRLRDWLISRQRYWGAPIPIVHCEKCGEVPVPEDQLPVLLPDVEQYQPTGTGESPLAAIPEFVITTCPSCGAAARRETDTMGGFACSSWYFLRFADPHNDEEAFSRQAADYWLPVDLYSGGAEHAVMHLLYARFWTKVMFDTGLVRFDEPFQRLRNQGMLLAWTPGREVRPDEAVGPAGDEEEAAEDAGDEPIENWKVLRPEERETVPEDRRVYRWIKMSKSMGNVVTPDDIAEKYGTDTLRVYTLFVAPFEDTVQWKDSGVEGAYRYVGRVWRLWTDLLPPFQPDWREKIGQIGPMSPILKKLRRKLHQTIRKVGDDIENFRFNTAVAALMEFTNDLSALRNAIADREPTPEEAIVAAECIEMLPLVLSPIAPHMAEEMWERLGHSRSIYREAWPAVDEAAAAEDAVTIVVQVNGKVRARLEVAPDTDEAAIRELALADVNVRRHVEGKTIRKSILVPNKMLSLVVS
ncbi:leucine--tRNA ligase [Candidatus Sumerlaeota bacterium]|nr:leucine--tRNA ligase [Candidatus Sumerlaeota bacterium]